MEAHPDYSVCFHRCKHLLYPDNSFEDDAAGDLFQNGVTGVDVSEALFFRKWITQPLTMLFRKASFSSNWQSQYKLYRDTHEIYHLLKTGKGYLFNFCGGVRIKHYSGISSSNPLPQQIQIEYDLIKDLLSNNKDDSILKDYLASIIKFMLSRKDIEWEFSRVSLSKEYLRLTKDVRFIVKRTIFGVSSRLK